MNQEWLRFFSQAAILMPAFLISVSFHECAHAFVALLFGDDTAKKAGRLTLNPMAHLDVMGLLFLIVFRIGWATPVPMDQRNFRHPRVYAIITALAGPVSNFLLAYACFLGLHHFPESWFAPYVTATFVQIFTATAYVNIMLGVFNLLPIPPLDGGHMITALLINRYPDAVVWLYRYSFFILLMLFLLPVTRDFLGQLMVVTGDIIKIFVF